MSARSHDAGLYSEVESGDRDEPSRCGSLARKLILAVVVVAALTAVVLAFALRRKEDSTPSTPYDPSPVLKGCTHPVYCNDALLRAVNLAGIFNDSKTFVDMPIRANSTQVVLDAFAKISPSNRTQLIAFVNDHFDQPGSEIEAVTPADFTLNPTFLQGITDRNLSQFARDVHLIWPNLTRQFNTAKYCSDCVSSLSLPHSFVVPGGRFREFYYWDSFWILKGLLVSELNHTSRNLVRNIAALVDRYGFMPNGARVYYLDRSQPPVLAMMVELLVNATNDTSAADNVQLLRDVLPSLLKEQRMWRHDTNQISFRLPSTGETVTMFRYGTRTSSPRPESYIEDYETLLQTQGSRTAEDLFSNIAAGAETGWDFSTRWFKPNTTNMTDIITMQIAPVDLNMIMLRATEIIASIARTVGNADVARQYDQYANDQRATLLKVLRWSNFRDVIVPLNANEDSAPREGFYAALAVAGFVPSFVAQLSAAERDAIANSIVVDVGGVPTSLKQSGQQWDLPNAWPPLQWFAVMAFGNLGRTDKQLALAQAWIQSNYCAYRRMQIMIEKYSALAVGQPGGGGEYTVQLGFGWTNGVLLDFLSSIGKTATAAPCPS